MKERVLVYFSIIVCAFSFLSFRWPLDNGKVTSTFGESRGDHFHDGTDMISSSNKVYPVSNGKLLYAWNHALFPFDQYTGSGNFKVLVHDKGYASVYLHIEDSEDLKADYSESDALAGFGNTGRSYGNHIHFSIINISEHASLNPFPMLPEYKDTKAPQIGPYALRIGDKVVQIRNKSKIRLTKEWPLLIKLFDSAHGGERLGVYTLKVVFNDELVLDSKFDRIDAGKNGLTISGKNFDYMFDKEGYYKVENVRYRSGLNTCIVTATDFSGNRATDTLTIDITLDR